MTAARVPAPLLLTAAVIALSALAARPAHAESPGLRDVGEPWRDVVEPRDTGGPPPLAVWTERATVKVLPDRPPGAAPRPRLDAVRGEWEGFQIALRAARPLAGVDVTISDFAFVAGTGQVVPVRRTHVYREWLLSTAQASSCFPRFDCDGYPWELTREQGRYPDPLIPFADPYDPAHPPVGAPFDLPAGETTAIYVDVQVPRDTRWGAYVADIAVTAEGLAPIRFSATLVVHDVTLPAERRVATAYGLSEGAIRGYHGGPDGPSPEDEARLLRNYRSAMHEHLLDQSRVEAPVTFEYDDAGALLPVDWTDWDTYMGPLLDGGYWPDGQPTLRFAPAQFSPGRGKGGLSDSEWAQALAALAEHLAAKGWLGKAWLYARDEPFMPGHEEAWDAIPADVALLRAATDLWDGRVMVTNPFDERLAGSIDIWCPVTPMFDDWFWAEGHAGRADYDARRAAGEQLWFYVCNANFPPWAGYDTDARLGHEPRIVKWGAYAEHATGFLYWRMNDWLDDPWNDLADVAGFGPVFARNGDGVLFYPGDHDGTKGGLGSPVGVAIDGPIGSYRMKMIRDGLEDWELFLVAEEAGAGNYARAQVARAHRQFGAHVETGEFDPVNPPWTLDDEVLHDARRNVIAKVRHLRDPETWPDPEGERPPEPGPEPVDAGARDALRSGDGDRGPETALPDAAAPEDSVPPPDTGAGADTARTAGSGGGCAPTASGPQGASALAALLLVLLGGIGSAARRASRR